MWRQWGKSTVKIRETTPSPSPSFSFSSFKDIQHICTDDPSPPTKASSVFHRVRLANSIVRSWTPPSRSISHSQPDLQPPQLISETEANVSPVITTAPLECQEPLQLQPPPPPPPPPLISIPGAEKQIVVYFTSLRVVRSTFEDCRSVKSILQGFHVSIDERDLSMDARFVKELQQIFGGSQTKLSLPRVFIGGRYIGGADEIRELHEAGELKKFVQGLPAAEPGVCASCGGYRFILCHECNGSHKLYIEKSGFKSCIACNENGLIRCPSCSCAPF
ncbi:hypothetical protein JCGZ_17381 [Jatropha curcas]|uniref:Glutaredoxin domain-containing protein n=1 Tax=Jatropha curcas TaxID=180498 RepID=A0A067LMY0_JATCU|nr:uncharacterized protein At5g39865 [Jatropha curcas]KDP45774.1 hypothetical protein JCGZ_17381 [Jatropha curcas]